MDYGSHPWVQDGECQAERSLAWSWCKAKDAKKEDAGYQ
jgi:hypothetical protein